MEDPPVEELSRRAVRLKELETSIRNKVAALDTHQENLAQAMGELALLFLKVNQVDLAMDYLRKVLVLPDERRPANLKPFERLLEKCASMDRTELANKARGRMCNQCYAVRDQMGKCPHCSGDMAYYCSQECIQGGWILQHASRCSGLSDSPKGVNTNVCRYCQTESTKPLRCGGCQKILYCSAICQRSDWTRHKEYCKK